MTYKELFCSFYVCFCTFCASLQLKRTVFSRLLKKANNHSSIILNHLYGLHNFAFCILIFDFPLQSLAPNPSPLAPNVIVRKYLRVDKSLYNCRATITVVMSALQIRLFMQNKAKFRKVKFNVTNVLTKDYDQMDTWSIGKKQTQTKPIKPKSKKAKMNVTSILTVGYENKPPIRAPKKQSQISKRQKPMQTSLPKGIMKKTAFSASGKTNPTCRGVASGEAGNKPNACPPSVWRVRGKTTPAGKKIRNCK